MLKLSDLNPVFDARFLDSYGNVVQHGSKIEIFGRQAFVEWFPILGKYRYIFLDDESVKRNNFTLSDIFRVSNKLS